MNKQIKDDFDIDIGVHYKVALFLPWSKCIYDLKTYIMRIKLFQALRYCRSHIREISMN